MSKEYHKEQRRQKGSTIFFDPEEYINLAKDIKYWMGKGLTSFEDIANKLEADFGPMDRQKLEKVWMGINRKEEAKPATAQVPPKPQEDPAPLGSVVNGSDKIIKQLLWIFGVLVYSFLAALIPGVIWIFGGFLYNILGKLGDGANWFMGLSWGIKITVYIVLGLFLQLCRPMFNPKK